MPENVTLRVSYPTEGYKDVFALRPSASVCPKTLHSIPDRKPNGGNTARFCVGMTKLARAGFIVFCPWDLNFHVGKKPAVTIPDDYYPPVEPMIHYHEDDAKPFLQNKHVFKIETGMAGKDFSETDYIVHAPTMHNQRIGVDYDTVTGILNFAESSPINIFLCFDKSDQDKIVQVRAGDPIAQIIPMTRSDVVLDERVGHSLEYNFSNFFSNDGRNRFYKLKSHLTRIGITNK